MKSPTTIRNIKRGFDCVITVPTSLYVSASIAMAQEGDCAKPVVDLTEKAETGLAQILAIFVGIGVMVIGGKSAVTGDLDLKKLGYSIAGGGLVILGPKMVEGLLGAVS